MFTKIKEWSGVGALVVLIALLLIPGAGQGSKLGNATASFQEADLGFYIGSQPFGLNTGGTYVTGFFGDLVQGAGGFSLTISTSTTLTPAQFCAQTNVRYLNSTASVTTTFPAATSTWLACGSGAYGGWENQIVTNDSTNTAVFVAGTGMTFQCETTGPGTTTVLGGCTSSTVSINATSTAFVSGYWDGASSTFVMVWGNEFH